MNETPLSLAETLYKQGKYAQALDVVQNVLKAEPENGDALALQGWCQYQLADYVQASVSALQAGGENQRALQLRMTLHAYAKTGMQNRDKMLELAVRITDKVVVANALLIIAKDESGMVTPDDVVARVMECVSGVPSVNVAHVLQNAGRYFHRIHRTTADYAMALGFLVLAYARYGSGDSNLNHRAAALYWSSQCAKELGDAVNARMFAVESLKLRERHLAIAPDDERVQKDAESARKYLATFGE